MSLECADIPQRRDFHLIRRRIYRFTHPFFSCLSLFIIFDYRQYNAHQKQGSGSNFLMVFPVLSCVNSLFASLGGMFLLLSLLFLPGIPVKYSRFYYPGASNVLSRAAAPVIFACLAIAFFLSVGIQAMIGVVATGVVLIVLNRRKRRKV